MTNRSLDDRKMAGHPYVTVAELHARRGVNPQIVDTYVERIQPRQSPIIVARFGGAA